MSAILILALTLWSAGWQPRLNAQVQTPGRGTKNLINAVIATFPTRPAALSGQSLMVRTVFDNRGTSTIDAPSRDAASEFAYILRSQKEGGPQYGLSSGITFRRRSPDRVGTPPQTTEPLAGGAKFEWMEDIADFWNEGFEPGKYWLTARYDAAGLESPKSEVRVLPLNVEGFSSFSTDGHLASIVAHRRSDGQITLLQRESDVRDPREGVFFVRQVLPAGGPVSVAIAIDVAPAGSGRWFAWARDGKLTASNGWADQVMLTTQPITADGILLSPGFQIAVGTGLFGLVSPAGDLQTYLATRDGLKKHWSAKLGGGTVSGKVLWNAQPDGSIVAAWEDGGGRVMRRLFAADGRTLEAAPQAVTPGRPLAWGLSALGAPTVWAVVANGSDFGLARIGPTGERSLLRIPPLSGATAWDFHDAREGAAPIVAAVVGETLHSTRLDSPVWRTSERPMRQARAMHIVSLNDRTMWAEWIEPGFGVRRVKLP